MRDYILFDSSQHAHFHRHLDRSGAAYCSLFDGYPEEPFLDIAPLLIDVTTETDKDKKLIDKVLHIGQTKPCVSTFRANLPLKRMADHLRQFHLSVTCRSATMLVRWYDTRVTPAWLEALNPEQLACFAHPIEHMSIFDRFGTKQECSLPPPGDVAPKVPIPVQIDEEQEEALKQASQPDALIHELGKNYEHVKNIHQRVLYPFVKEHWQMAKMHGLHEHADQLQFLMLAICTSGHFVDHPRFNDLLASSAKHLFGEKFQSLPQEVWQSGKPLWETA